ncbi:MAG: hypothetical protein PHR06_09705 [Candidatus Cloacimonetes bacterium]|nr:hypothetical protein [Candidatus Cloacimonadota bacterium]
MRIILIILLLVSLTSFYAYTSKETIKTGRYYYGEYNSDDETEARERALHRLSENISVTISSDFKDYIEEKDGNVRTSASSIINSYSNITLRNLTPIREINQGNYYYLYYIHQDSLRVLYNERKKVICDIYNEAEKMHSGNNLAGALQYYYYAIVMMNSIPETNIMHGNSNLRTLIPSRIKKIFNETVFTLIDDNKEDEIRTLTFNVTYNGNPVSKLDFIYAERNSEYYTVVRDGKVVCKLTGPSVNYKDMDIRIEYKFSKDREIIREVNQLWNVVRKPNFEDNRRNIRLRKAKPEKLSGEKQTQIAGKQKYDFYTTQDNECPIADKIYEEAAKLISVLSNADVRDIAETYASDQFLQEKLKEIIKYNNPAVILNSMEVKINETAEGWEMRSVPLSCTYKSLDKQSTEYLVLDFDHDGMLQDANFTIFNQMYEELVEQCSDENEKKERLIIIKFLEKYRTAYLNRDLEVLENIFAEQAIIIIGRKLEFREPPKDIEYQKLNENQPDIEYLQMNKVQFLVRQRNIFNSQKDIHLSFNTINISKKDKDSRVYGVEMRQMYNSTGYSDEGHLFLLIDFEGVEPLIYIRSWQPQEWSRDQIIQMANFKILG